MRSALLILLVLVAACQAPAPPRVVTVVDSTCLLARDSLQSRLREQVILIRLAEQQMKRYAKIVARDPTQTRFIVGWTNRAFAGVVVDSAR